MFSVIFVMGNLLDVKVEKIVSNYLFREREPLRDEVQHLAVGAKSSGLDRKSTGNYIRCAGIKKTDKVRGLARYLVRICD